jgi:putative hydrolase of the HAD superfamily
MAIRRLWLFDLDNVLHDALARIMPAMAQQMNTYLRQAFQISEQQASLKREQLWRQHGSTLAGLQRHVPAFDAVWGSARGSSDFLLRTHQFPDLHRWITRDNPRRHAVAERLRRWSPQPVIVTNAPEAYARQVLKFMGLRAWAEKGGKAWRQRLYCIEQSRLRGRWFAKPSRQWLRHICAQHRVSARHCVHIEDTWPNLVPAHQLGMATVYLRGHVRRHARTYPHSRHLHAGTSRRASHQVQSVLTLRRSHISRRF